MLHSIVCILYFRQKHQTDEAHVSGNSYASIGFSCVDRVFSYVRNASKRPQKKRFNYAIPFTTEFLCSNPSKNASTAFHRNFFPGEQAPNYLAMVRIVKIGTGTPLEADKVFTDIMFEFLGIDLRTWTYEFMNAKVIVKIIYSIQHF